MQRLMNQIKSSVGFIAGGVTTHFISKALEIKNTQIEKEAQLIRDQKIDQIADSVNMLKDQCTDLKTSCDSLLAVINNTTIFNEPSDKVIQEMSDKATDTQELGNTLNQLMENKASISDQGVEQQVIDFFTKLQANSNELREFVDQINEKINSEGLNKNFIGNFNLDYFTTYLDSLSLLQEAALIHILLFIIILLTLINIFASLFANELLNYFDLEHKFPSISGFLKLRAKFQKYYLSWNIFFLLILIIAAIFLNIFIFIVC